MGLPRRPPGPVAGHRAPGSMWVAPARLWRAEARIAAISACKRAPLLSARSALSSQAIASPSTNLDGIPQHHSAREHRSRPPEFRIPLTRSRWPNRSAPTAVQRIIPMASTSCVMSAVAGSSVACALRAQAERVAPPNNVLLSARRASTISGVALPSLARSNFRAEAKRTSTIVASKATKEAESTVNETTAAVEDFLQSLQAAWEKSDDKPAIAGLVFSGLIGIWASFGLINAIEKLPLIPDLFEIVGILFSGWFVYRYLLFKPDREELLKLVDEAKARITGQ